MQEPQTKQTLTAEINFLGQARKFRLFDSKLSQTVCAEIFRGESYPLLAVGGTVRTILDIGANIGAASLYFALQYPEASVIAVEPSPSCFALLRENTAALPNVTAWNIGLSDRSGKASLFQGDQDSVTNSLAAGALNSTANESVELRDADEFVAAHATGVDLLKLDTEGHELPILRSLQLWLPRIAILYVEYHSESDRREIDRLLAPTHLLWHAKAEMPHRGELAYVMHERVPDKYRKLRIESE